MTEVATKTPKELRFQVRIAPNATVLTFPVGFTVSLRSFVSIADEHGYNAASHIEEKHVHLKGSFATREELAQRVLRGYSDVMVGAGGAAPTSFNKPSKAGYFLSVAEANTQIEQVINGELPLLWATAAKTALEGPNHYYAWTSSTTFPRHPQAGLRRNNTVGTNAQLEVFLTNNDIAHPDGPGGRYRIYPLYPGDPNYEFEPKCGHPDNTARPLTIPEFPAGANYPVRVGLSADPGTHVPGGWYVNSAYPEL